VILIFFKYIIKISGSQLKNNEQRSKISYTFIKLVYFQWSNLKWLSIFLVINTVIPTDYLLCFVCQPSFLCSVSIAPPSTDPLSYVWTSILQPQITDLIISICLTSCSSAAIMQTALVFPPACEEMAPSWDGN